MENSRKANSNGFIYMLANVRFCFAHARCGSSQAFHGVIRKCVEVIDDKTKVATKSEKTGGVEI